jgi:hypothetical protein
MPIEQFLHNDITNAPPRIRRVINYFPTWMRDSAVIHAMSTRIAEEPGSRIPDLFDLIGLAVKPIANTGFLLNLWEETLGLAINPSDGVLFRKAKILTKLIRKQGVKVSDITTIIRFYLNTPRSFTRSAINNSNIIPVDSLIDFFVGQNIFVGSVPATIIGINLQNSSLIIDRNINGHIFEIVTSALVQLEEDFPNYFFTVFLDLSTIYDVFALGRAISESKPAHLDYILADIITEQFFFEDEDSVFEGTATLGPRLLR